MVENIQEIEPVVKKESITAEKADDDEDEDDDSKPQVPPRQDPAQMKLEL